MNEIETGRRQGTFTITLNRVERANAFHHDMLLALHEAFEKALQDTSTKVIIIRANGKHFSAGADLSWMQQASHWDEQENYEDALVLSKLLYRIYTSEKPTITMVHGAAFGGGAGLVAASDIVIAGKSAHFCFSEVSLGLTPATISPYVIHTLGEKTARWLFLSAHRFDAKEAKSMGFVSYVVDDEELIPFGFELAHKISSYPPNALINCKKLTAEVALSPIDETLVQRTAHLLAKQRASREAREGFQAFLTSHSKMEK